MEGLFGMLFHLKIHLRIDFISLKFKIFNTESSKADLVFESDKE